RPPQTTLSLHDALPISPDLTTSKRMSEFMNQYDNKYRYVFEHAPDRRLEATHVIGHENSRHQKPGEMQVDVNPGEAEKTNYTSRSEEHTSELQSLRHLV